MYLVLKLQVVYIWCCDSMRLGVQVMSACLVDVSVADRVAIVLSTSILGTLHSVRMVQKDRNMQE